MPDAHDAIGIGKRQRPQHHGIHDRKDRRVHADAQAKNQHAGEGEAGALHQRAGAIPHIADERFEYRNAAAIAVLLLGLLDASKSNERAATRFLWRHPRLEVVVDVQLQVAFELRGQIALGSVRGKHTKESQ